MSEESSEAKATVVARLNVECELNEPDDTISVSDTVSAGGGESSQKGGGLVRHNLVLRDNTVVRVGRATSNELVVRNRNVSRFHAVFNSSSSGVVLSDLASTNGTIHNGNRISTPVDLGTGDVVQIGPAKIVVQLNIGASEGVEEPMDARTQTDKMSAGIVTVLVVDVKGYTKMSELLPSDEVTGMLQAWFNKISEVVNEHGGEVDKYIGDCVMALWKSSHKDAPESAMKAARAALECKKQTDLLSEGKWKYHEQFAWKCRTSLNTGDALIGAVGVRGSRDFTVLGDTVNVAFRLDSVAGQMAQDFIVSASTAEHIQDEIPLKNLGPVEVKGRTQKVTVFTLAK